MTEALTLRQYLEQQLEVESEFYPPSDRRSDHERDFVFRKGIGLTLVVVEIKDFYEKRGFRLNLEDETTRSSTLRFVDTGTRAFVEIRTDAQGHIYVSLTQSKQ